jgi:PAS domain S-box-containing protein
MLRILSIDDEPDLLELCKRYLEDTGEFAVDTATSAGQAMEMLRNAPYDLIISDYQMPGMDGITLLKTLRGSGNTLPFILFTGRGREEVVIEALNNGADYYIQKGGDPEAQFTQLTHTIQQVVGKRKADEQIREMNTYLESLITYAANPIVTWDVDSKITRFNRAFERLTGFSEDNVRGHDFDILFPEESRAQSLDLVVKALFGEKWEGVEIPVRTIHADIRTVIWNSANIYGTDGTTPVATIAMGTDITGRKRAEVSLKAAYEDLAATEEELRQQYELLGAHERLLRANQDQLESILRTTPTGIGILKDQVIKEANNRLCEMTGYSHDELATLNIHNIWPEADTSLPAGRQNRTDQGTPDAQPVEARWQRKDGTIIRILFSCGLLNPKDPGAGITISAIDITTHMMGDDALRMANKKLNLLSSITRHDILNKISIIDSNIIFIQKRNPPPEIDAFLLKIGSTTRAIQTQIEFSRVYQNLGSTDSRWQKIDSVLPRRMVPESLQFEADCEGVEVFADPMLQKVFFNLFDNSLRHGGHVHEIRVTCREDGDGLKIVWDDDGIGIPSDEKERIFERGVGKNTGLGLFLVREILGITGISLLEKGIPGKGASFEIRVPRGVYRYLPEKKEEKTG